MTTVVFDHPNTDSYKMCVDKSTYEEIVDLDLDHAIALHKNINAKSVIYDGLKSHVILYTLRELVLGK